MKESFKNVERLRYRISNDIHDVDEKAQQRARNQVDKISSTVFAAIFSALITEITSRAASKLLKSDCHLSGLLYYIISLALFVGLYIILYWIYDRISSKIQKYRRDNGVHNYGATHREEIKKDFDNIACDSVIVSLEYKDDYLNLKAAKGDSELLLFYYFEMLHYIGSAYEKTESLVSRRECIMYPGSSNVDGVDIFRITNLIHLMINTVDFLKQEITSVCPTVPMQKDAHDKCSRIESGLTTTLNTLTQVLS